MTRSHASAAALARAIRADSLRMVTRSNASHIGGCLSMADLLSVLYFSVLRLDATHPLLPARDRFILSKGHGAAILYAVLAECDFFPLVWLDDYCSDGSVLMGHASHLVPGVEVSTGSLGHGLPIAVGMALAAKRDGKDYRVFALLGDGELDEGSNWEAMLFAATHDLDQLVMIVDRNRLQGFGESESVLRLEPLAEKFASFGWAVVEIDGHDLAAIERALSQVPAEPSRPTAVIAHTVKGKGVSFMENRMEWHYHSPNPEQLAEAFRELGVQL